MTGRSWKYLQGAAGATTYAPERAKNRFLFGCLLVCALLSSPARAATAPASVGIMGKVVSSQTGDPLPYATVALFRLATATDSVGIAAGGALTKADGTYRLPAAAGVYRLAISYVSHRPAKSAVLEVSEGAPPVVKDFALTPDAVKLETVQVTAKIIRDNDAAILAKQRRASAVSDAVSSQQIARTSDANAAEVLQRVTGLSVVGGRYIYVRGLGERYSATQINGATVGTPEPNKRVVPLDLFASGLLDNIVVQKTYTPDQPGEFGGGVVNLSTRDFPGQRITNFALSTGYNSATTGQDFYRYHGGDRDFLGFDDGTRAIPDAVERIARNSKITPRSFISRAGFSPDTLALLGRSFSNNWDRKRARALPAVGFAGTYADEFIIHGRELGVLGSLTYSGSRQTSESKDNIYFLDPLLEPDAEYRTTVSSSNVLWGAIANGSYRVNDYNSIAVRTMYNRSAESTTRYYEGYNWTWNNGLQNTRLSYVQRGMLVGSLSTNSFVSWLGGSTVDLRFNYSRADRDEPDRREYTYQEVMGETGSFYRLTEQALDLGLTRMYGEMNEEERGPEATVTYPFRQWSGLDAKLKAGFAYRNKDRDSRWRRFGYKTPTSVSGAERDSLLSLTPEQYLDEGSIGGRTADGFVITELTKQDTDSYRGHLDVAAEYLMLDLPVSSKLRAVVGGRVEHATMDVRAYDIFHQLADSMLSRAHLDNTDFLPSVNVTYAWSGTTNLRMAYSSTVSRPDFRELSEQNFYDFIGGYPEVGNPDLKRARIRSWDLRVENFPAANALFAASLFHKKLFNPIENSIVGGSVPTKMPVNAHSGYLMGGEVEARLGLAMFTPALTALAVTGNVSLVKSETDLTGLGVGTSSKPPLQGQSPYVINLGVYYASPKGGLTGAALYNVFGRRLDRVGVQGQPDIYEEPRHSLDLTLTRAFRRSKIKLAVENVFDGQVRFDQRQPAGVPRGDAPASRVVYESHRGRVVSLSISNG